MTGKAQIFDLALLGIAAALVLVPFFSELTFLGVTLKQQVDETKKELKHDLKEQVLLIRSEFQNVVNVNNRVNPQFFFGLNPAPPPDTQLGTLEEQIKVVLENALKERGLTATPQTPDDLEPSTDIVFAFSSRLQIEREVRRIWHNRSSGDWDSKDTRRFFPLHRTIEDLVRGQILSPAVAHSIREVYSVCSPAIHGETPTEPQIRFLQDVVPSLVATLKAIA